MPDFLPLVLAVLVGIAIGFAIQHVRSRTPHTPQHAAPANADADEALTAKLAERSREVEALRARVATLERLEKDIALSDPLTGIANRTLLSSRIDHAITRGQRYNTRLGVIVLEIADFAAIEQRLERQGTERLLIAAARKLRETMRAEDTVAFMQGGRFAVALEGTFEREDIDRARESALRAFAEPFIIDNQDVALQAQIGTALYPADGANAEALLRTAEHNLNHARKSRGTA